MTETATATVDAVVIGAGVVGLATARSLSLAGRDVVIIETTVTIGSATSSRNSEVIHAGIYYPAGSLKAHPCVAGKHRLYDFCESRGVPHRRLGKMIAATTLDQMGVLETSKKRRRRKGSMTWKLSTPARRAGSSPR